MRNPSTAELTPRGTEYGHIPQLHMLQAAVQHSQVALHSSATSAWGPTAAAPTSLNATQAAFDCTPSSHTQGPVHLQPPASAPQISMYPDTVHWLPVHFRIYFKIILFAFKALNGLAPPYISELLHPYTPSRSHRSADQLLLTVPKARLKLRVEHFPFQLQSFGRDCRCTSDRPPPSLILKLFL